MSTELHFVAPAKQEVPATPYWLKVLRGFPPNTYDQYVWFAAAQDGGLYLAADTYDDTYANIQGPTGHITPDGVLTFGNYGIWSPYDLCATGEGWAYTALDGSYSYSAIFRLDELNGLQWAKRWTGAEYSMSMMATTDVLWTGGDTAPSPHVGVFVSKIADADGAVQASWKLSHDTYAVSHSRVLVEGDVVYISYIVNRGGYNNNSHGVFAMTTAGVKLWDRTFTRADGWTYIGYDICLADGYLYVVGGRFYAFPERDSHVFKISAATGELVWTKKLASLPIGVSANIGGVVLYDDGIYVSVIYYLDGGLRGVTALLKMTSSGVIDRQLLLSHEGVNSLVHANPLSKAGDSVMVGGGFYADILNDVGLTNFAGRLPLYPEAPVTFGPFTWEDTPFTYSFDDITADMVVVSDYVTLTPAAYVLEDFAVPAYSPGIDHREIS